MQNRSIWVVSVCASLGVIAAKYAGPALAGLSDETWWQVLPWPLLVVFWVFMGLWVRRSHGR